MRTPFDALLSATCARLDALTQTSRMLHYVDELRGGRLSRTTTLQASLERVLLKNSSPLPTSVECRRHNHCASVTSLYSLFEQFVFELMEAWLNELPRLYPQYSSLPEQLRNSYRQGVGQILCRPPRQRRMSESTIIEGYHKGLSGSNTYTLLLDAFRHERSNLWPQTLDELFKRVGVRQPSSWYRKFSPLEDHIEVVWGGATTASSTLEALVKTRNEAAHGSHAELWAFDEWQRYEAFVRILCKMLTEMVAHAFVESAEKKGMVSCVGPVVHRFENNVVGVRLEPCSLKEGVELVAFSTNRCYTVIVQRIEIDKKHRPRIQPKQPRHVGLELSRPVPKKTRFFKL